MQCSKSLRFPVCSIYHLSSDATLALSKILIICPVAKINNIVELNEFHPDFLPVYTGDFIEQ